MPDYAANEMMQTAETGLGETNSLRMARGSHRENNSSFSCVHRRSHDLSQAGQESRSSQHVQSLKCSNRRSARLEECNSFRASKDLREINSFVISVLLN